MNRNENLDFLLVTRKRSKEQHTKTSDYWYRVLLLKETAVDYALFWWAGAMIMHNLTLIKTVLMIILLTTLVVDYSIDVVSNRAQYYSTRCSRRKCELVKRYLVLLERILAADQ